MKIAYVGPERGTSLHRARALERLGHSVFIVDPWSWLGTSKWGARWLHHTGGIGVGLRVDNRIVEEVSAASPDVVWVDQGPFLGRALVKRLRDIGSPIVNYTLDDPFGGRDGRRFRRYLRALPYYDLVAVVRDENVSEAKKYGARRVVRIWRSADEIAHRPSNVLEQGNAPLGVGVCFIGTWMPERGRFMAELIERGVPLAIWGDRWHKAKEWPIIAANWRGPGIYDDMQYAATIRSARVCIGLLSKGNRDLHTQRSLEIPALGGVFCGERTTEHVSLYEEGKEAVFWDDVRECAVRCMELVNDDNWCRALRRGGLERARRNNYFNEPVLKEIIDAL